MILFVRLAIFCTCIVACAQKQKDHSPVLPAKAIVKDLMSWLYYQRDYMLWSADYTTIDQYGATMPKKDFLEQLASGGYLPLRVTTTDSSVCYQLYQLADTVNDEVKTAIKEAAITEYQHFKMEGSVLPNFNFKDIDGNIFNAETIGNKTVVINCWFIRCKPCVQEIPVLNKIVERFKNKKVVFIGLAFDKVKDLRAFLKKTEFRYAIIPEKQAYMMDTLKLNGYPSHIVLDNKGVILKVMNNNDGVTELNALLDKVVK